jgi:phospholipid transport system transporter-binding protein
LIENLTLAQINKTDSRWEIDGDVTIVHAQILLAESKSLPTAATLLVDFSKVTYVDTATISLIFEWLRQAQSKKCDLKFANFPKNLLSLIALYGVVDLIPQVTH